MSVLRDSKIRDMTTMERPWERTDVVWLDHSGAYTIQRVSTEWDYALEGYFLAHCLATKDVPAFEKVHRVYSVRDSLNIPHATILCCRADRWSEYGRSADLGTDEPFWPEGEDGLELTVLQVRGREDRIAMLPYHRIVRKWYQEKGGDTSVPDSLVDEAVLRLGDTDYAYHFQYKLDESVNAFNWSFHNKYKRTVARRDGTSL